MKRVWTLVALALLLASVFALAAACTAEEGGEPTEPTEVAKVGETVTLEGTSYKVTKVKTAESVGDDFMKEKADGVFVIVNLTLTNKKDEPATIMGDAITLVGGNDAEYSISTDASMVIEDSLLLLEEIQPDSPKKVVAVYDVPKKALKGAQLVVEDFWSDATAAIDLGL